MSNVNQFVDRKVQTLENKEINGGEASNQSRIILPKGTTSQLSALERKEGIIAFDTTLGQVVVDNGTSFTPTSNPGDITAVNAGVGLDGGGTSGSVTLDLADTAVTPGSYTSADITVDAQGRITAAANGTGGANTTLSNLGATAVNASIIPAVDNTINLGAVNKMYSNVFTPLVYSGAALDFQADVGNISFYAQSEIVGVGSYSGSTPGSVGFYNESGTEFVGLRAPTGLASSQTYILPSADGTNGQFLSTDGAGILSWQTAGGSFDPNTSPVEFLNSFINMRDDAADWWTGSNTKIQSGNAMTDNYIVIGTQDLLAGGDVKKNLALLTGTQDGGPNGGTGQIDLVTGYVWQGTGNSGDFFITTGGINSGVTGNSGAFNIQSGDNGGTGSTGAWNFRTGNASAGNSGNVSIATGTASGTRGTISFNGRNLNLSAAPLGSNWVPDTNATWNLGSGSAAFGQVFAAQLLSNTGNVLTLAGDAGIDMTATPVVQLPTAASDPSPLGAGSIYYNTTTNKLKFYNGTTWETVTSA